MVVPSFLGRLSVVSFLVFSILLGQPATPTQTSTTTLLYTSSVTAVTTYTSTSSTFTTSTIIMSTTVDVRVIGTISVDKVITQFDIVSQPAIIVATLVASLLGAGAGAFLQSRREGGLLVHENRVYCRKHGVLVSLTPSWALLPRSQKGNCLIPFCRMKRDLTRRIPRGWHESLVPIVMSWFLGTSSKRRRPQNRRGFGLRLWSLGRVTIPRPPAYEAGALG